MQPHIEEAREFENSGKYFVIKWLGEQREVSADLVWVFEYVLKYVVPEEKTPPIYYRWIHQMLLDGNIEKYIFRVMTGEGVVIDTKILGDMGEIDPGEVLVNLSGAYLASYEERIKALDAFEMESFDLETTLKRMYSEIRRLNTLPARVVLLETLRDHGCAKELNQTVLHVNWVYVMVYR